jgi:hypothetical protein
MVPENKVERQTEGEQLFEQYLRLNQWQWEREQVFGLKKPDYLVEFPETKA